MPHYPSANGRVVWHCMITRRVLQLIHYWTTEINRIQRISKQLKFSHIDYLYKNSNIIDLKKYPNKTKLKKLANQVSRKIYFYNPTNIKFTNTKNNA